MFYLQAVSPCLTTKCQNQVTTPHDMGNSRWSSALAGHARWPFCMLCCYLMPAACNTMLWPNSLVHILCPLDFSLDTCFAVIINEEQILRVRKAGNEMSLMAHDQETEP